MSQGDLVGQLDPRRGAAWLAAFGAAGPEPGRAWGGGDAGAAGALSRPGSRRLALLEVPPDWAPALGEVEGCRVLFDGELHNRTELVARLADRLPPQPGDAHVVGQAYRCWGDDVVHHLKGIFTLVVWDPARDRLLCARDPLGLHPLFYADVGRTLLLSPSVETLLAHPDVSSELNRAGLVEHLTSRWPKGEETYFAHVRRLPPGHAMRVSAEGRAVWRYWTPVPFDRPIEWIPDDEAQGRVDALLEQTIERCLALGPAGICLSGGLDSATVARLAGEICRRRGWDAPWALSLGFPQDTHDDPVVQRGVATALGFPHVQIPFDAAPGPGGTLGAALDLSRTMPAPVQGIIRPGLVRLALEGRQRGCSVLLTGEGADEWLGVNSFLAADLLRSLDLVGLYRLWRILARSYPHSSWLELRSLLGRYGTLPLLRELWNAPTVLAPLRDLRRRRLAEGRAATIPAWLAPEPTLRARVAERIEESRRSVAAGPAPTSYYLECYREMLDTAPKWAVLEEGFLLARRAGLRLLHPFWDADLAALLVRISPQAKARDGRTKALVRATLVERFPGLGFERRRKSWVAGALAPDLPARAAEARAALGGTAILGELGVVDPTRASEVLDAALAGRVRNWGNLAFNILNLESWARAHYRL
jgi:asparagine synthase (glutamine-hydrolysing)